MSQYGPIVWLEDDQDDQHLLQLLVKELEPKRALLMFDSGDQLLAYLRGPGVQPFLILSDINMPGLNGLQVRSEINKDEALRRKAVPFVFFSTTAGRLEVSKAYDMTVQGFFEKGSNFDKLRDTLRKIFDYWRECKHPNSFD